MTDRSFSPLAVAVGIAAVTADGVRKLPGLLLGLPPAVVRELSEARHAALHRYDELALHGRDVLAGRPGSAARDRAVDSLSHLIDTDPPEIGTPSGVGLPAPADHAPAPADHAPAPVAVPAPVTEDGPRRVADPEEVVEPRTAPPVPTPPIGRTEPVTLPDELLDEVAQLTPGAELAHSDLPLPDFDHQTVPQLRGRLRTLGLPELVQLRDYEQAHGHRLPVLTLLDNRIAKLLAEPDDAS